MISQADKLTLMEDVDRLLALVPEAFEVRSRARELTYSIARQADTASAFSVVKKAS